MRFEYNRSQVFVSSFLWHISVATLLATFWNQSRVELHELYEALGKRVYKSLKENSLDPEDPAYQDFVQQIDDLQKDLESMEGDVNKIKFSDKNEE